MNGGGGASSRGGGGATISGGGGGLRTSSMTLVSIGADHLDDLFRKSGHERVDNGHVKKDDNREADDMTPRVRLPLRKIHCLGSPEARREADRA